MRIINISSRPAYHGFGKHKNYRFQITTFLLILQAETTHHGTRKSGKLRALLLKIEIEEFAYLDSCRIYCYHLIYHNL